MFDILLFSAVKVAQNLFLIKRIAFCSSSDQRSQPSVCASSLVTDVNFKVFKVAFDDNTHQRMRLVY